jgi:hypothetical protein
MRDHLAAGPEVLRKFQGMTTSIDSNAAPKEALFVAQTLGVLDGDCEPCVQISVDIGLADGLSPELVRAILLGDETAMTDDARLAFRFARESLAKDVAGQKPHPNAARLFIDFVRSAHGTQIAMADEAGALLFFWAPGDNLKTLGLAADPRQDPGHSVRLEHRGLPRCD